jgi:hypothetical protein
MERHDADAKIAIASREGGCGARGRVFDARGRVADARTDVSNVKKTLWAREEWLQLEGKRLDARWTASPR